MTPIDDERASFFEGLRLFTPMTRVTTALIVINTGLWIFQISQGIAIFSPSSQALLDWGANYGPATLNGDYWRLLTAPFLHAGALHLALNMWALRDAGPLVERLYGPGRFATIYFASAVAGSIASLNFAAYAGISVGASGAIYGVLGALLAVLFNEKALIPADVRRRLLLSIGLFGGLSLAAGFVVPGIDNAAHLGGLGAGFIVGRLLTSHLDPLHRMKTGWPALIMMIVAGALSLPSPPWNDEDEQQCRRQLDSLHQKNAAFNHGLEQWAAERRRRPSHWKSPRQYEAYMTKELNGALKAHLDSLSATQTLAANFPEIPACRLLVEETTEIELPLKDLSKALETAISNQTR